MKSKREGMSCTSPQKLKVMKMVDWFFENLEGTVILINKVFVFVASLMMSGLVIIVCSDIFLRYFLRSPLVWSTEVTEILLLDITFLGTAWVFKENGHVVIDVFTAKAEEKTKKVLNFISYILIAIVCWVLIYYGFSTTYEHYVGGVYNPTAIETPISLIIVVIPLGSIPLFLEVFLKGRKLFKK
jgi:TRAP-type C4-dicarboxylate transport system permease small subunit